jgi:hypothetical protein
MYRPSHPATTSRLRLAPGVRGHSLSGNSRTAADAKWSQDAMDGTFALSNMSPQVGEGFNRDYWEIVGQFGAEHGRDGRVLEESAPLSVGIVHAQGFRCNVFCNPGAQSPTSSPRSHCTAPTTDAHVTHPGLQNTLHRNPCACTSRLRLAPGVRGHSLSGNSRTVWRGTWPGWSCPKLSDYFRSGYDRGHQVPAADAKWSQDAMDGTFALGRHCSCAGIPV